MHYDLISLRSYLFELMLNYLEKKINKVNIWVLTEIHSPSKGSH